jgi:hypothetical protein
MSEKATEPTTLQASKVLLARLTRLTATIPGLDASLMLVQYSSPIVIALLLRLAKFRADHPRIRMSDKAVAAGAGAGLVRLATGWGKMAGSVGDARVVMRAFGKLSREAAKVRTAPHDSMATCPAPGSTRFLAIVRLCTVPSSQHELPANSTSALSLVLLSTGAHRLAWEHGCALSSPGNPWQVGFVECAVLGVSPIRAVLTTRLYVLLNIYKLRHTQLGLKAKTRAMRSAKPLITPEEAEGYEMETRSPSKAAAAGPSGADQVKQLKGEWVTWKDAVVVNA